MKIRKIISVSLIAGILSLTIQKNSFSGTLSEDGRYETFEGSNIFVGDVLKEDKVDVEVEGNTLVNLIDYSKINTYHYNYNAGYISENNSDDRPWGGIEQLSNLKPNTYYTVVVDDLDTASSMHMGFNGNWTREIFNKVTVFQTPSVINYGFVFKVHGKQANIRIMLLEGDWTNKEIPEYFEGMKPVGELEGNILKIKSQNKNLFNTNNLYVQDSAGNNETASFEVSGDSVFITKKQITGASLVRK